MTAILSMCLGDGAFVATDAGFEGDAEDGGRTFQVNEYTAMSGMGHAPAVRRVAVELANQIEDDDTQEEILALARETVERVSETAQRNHPDLDTTFQVVLSGYASESDSGYVASIESPDYEDPEDEVQTEAGQLHAAGANVDLLLDVHSEVRDSVIMPGNALALDVWGSTVVAVAAEKDDAIRMPATVVRVDENGYHEATTDSRFTSPSIEFVAEVEPGT